MARITSVPQSLAVAWTYVTFFLALDWVNRTCPALPGALQALKEPNYHGPIAVFTTYVLGPIYCLFLVALGGILAAALTVKLTDTTFKAINTVVETSSDVLGWVGLSIKWRFACDFRTAILSLMDYLIYAANAFFDVSPYAVLVLPIAKPCTKGFEKAKTSRWTASPTKMIEGISNLAYGLVISPTIDIAKAVYNIYMDTAAAFTSLAISSWVAANTLPIYFLWATYQHGLRGAIGLTAAHGISFTPSSVAPALHRTAGAFLGGIGIDCPKVINGTKAEAKPSHSTAVNLTASSTATPP